MYNNSNFFSSPASMYYSSFPKPHRASLLSKIKGVNWNHLLDNTSRTLNVIHQAIPLYYQVRPLFKNASTLFKIADIIRTDDREQNFGVSGGNTSLREEKKEETISSSGPTFFL